MDAITPVDQRFSLPQLLHASPRAPLHSYDPAAPVRILFVEDTELDYELMLRALKAAKFPLSPDSIRVEEETAMRKALGSTDDLTSGSLPDGAPWDVVISDYRLPRFSAQAAMRLVRASGRDIPFLVVSGAVGEDVAVQLMHDGADDYVMKHNLSRLPAALALALQAAAVRREHRVAVESLRVSEDYFRTLVGAAPVAIVALDGEGRITLFNPAANSLFEQLPALLGRRPAFAVQDSNVKFENLLREMRSGGAFSQRPVQWTFPSGRQAHLLFSAAPLHLRRADNEGAVLFAVDVTGQKKAEAAQRESESRVTAISDNLPGVLFRMVFDKASGEARLPYMSPGAVTLFGIAPEEFTASPQHFMNLFDLVSRDQIRDAVATSLASREALQGVWRIMRPDGAERWIQISASVQATASGDPLFDGVITDLSAQKQAEAELTQSREELRRLTAHMESVREDERRAVAREIHDDIGSILAGLKADAAWLKKRLEDDPAAAAKLTDMSALIDGTVQSANRIISSLRPGILDYGIGPALDWQLKDFGTRMGLEVSFRTNQDEVAMDLLQSTALFRVLQESLTNIAKHAQASRVDVEMFANSSNVSLEIRDNGCGFSEADLAKPASFGVRGMMERARALGGWLDIAGHEHGGTTLMVSVPRRHAGLSRAVGAAGTTGTVVTAGDAGVVSAARDGLPAEDDRNGQTAYGADA